MTMEDRYCVNVHFDIDGAPSPVIVDYHEDMYHGDLTECVYSDGYTHTYYAAFVGSKQECEKYIEDNYRG